MKNIKQINIKLTKIIENIKKFRFFEFTIKERIRIVISTGLMTFYFMVCFNIIPVETALIYQNRWRLLGVFLISFLFIFNIYIFLLNYKIKTVLKKKSYFVLGTIFVLSAIVFFALSGQGKITPDVQNQFDQAISGEYNNWHPTAHTFLFFKAPMAILGEDLKSVMIWQSMFVSLIVTYLIYSFYKFGYKPHVIVIIMTLMILNNKFRYIIKFPWKDIPFAFSILFLTVNLMWIYFSKGEWLKKTGNIFLLVLSLLLVIFLRHNGILAVVPTGIALLISYKNIRKRVLILSAATLAFFFVITGPIYGALNIESHPESFAEAMGVPNNQIAYIVKKEGNITEEESEFYSKIMPVGVIGYHYKIGDFNSVKWMENQAGTATYYDGEFLQNNQKEFLGTWFNIVKRNFKLAIEGYYYATREIWVCKMGIANKLTYGVGMAFFIATFFVAAAAFRDKRRLVPYIPMLFNMLGIMMLVTGGEIRFVFANLVCGMPLVLFALTPKDTLELPEKTVQ